MSVHLYEVKDIKKYWEFCAKNLEMTQTIYLRNKAEYGLDCSERGVQMCVLSSAERLARKYKLNENIVFVICTLVGCCFPKRGFAEMAVIKEYVRENITDVSLNTFEIDVIEYILDKIGNVVTPQLDELLHKYYSDDTTVAEVNLVRFLQKYMNMHREELKLISIYEAGHSIGEIMKRAESEYETSYRLLPNYDPPVVPKNIRDQIVKELREFIEYEGLPGGIYDFVW